MATVYAVDATRGTVRWLGNADETLILSYERSAAGESLVIAANLSSSAWAGEVKAEGAYIDITPDAIRTGATAAATLPELSLSPWEFRVFRRAPP